MLGNCQLAGPLSDNISDINCQMAGERSAGARPGQWNEWAHTLHLSLSRASQCHCTLGTKADITRMFSLGLSEFLMALEAFLKDE